MQMVQRTTLVALILVACTTSTAAAENEERQRVLATMKRATTFMVDKVAYRGGYVWSYLPDMSRRWGEMEAKPTMIWLQPPGTSSMGHVFLDAYHATRDEYYYDVACRVGDAIIGAQLDSGGWNYVADFAGEASLSQWYDTIGRNGWRLEEFQHYYGNGTFDDQVTTEAAKFLLRLYAEKHDARYQPALDRALAFVLDSQYPQGGWPQRYPKRGEFSKQGLADYTGYFTFNDNVAAENISFLLFYYQALGDKRVLEPIRRAMDFFLLTQQPAPQAGWALQYSPDLKPAAARTYEPLALATHTTTANIGYLIAFHELTGERKYLARIAEAIDWLESLPVVSSGRRPTFIELGSNKPLYVHRRGSNVVNGKYYVDYDSQRTLAHYSGTRPVNTGDLRKALEAATQPGSWEERFRASSPLAPGAQTGALPRYFVDVQNERYLDRAEVDARGEKALRTLNAAGYWPTPLKQISNPYKGDGPKTPTGDFATTYVGDETDTSPFTPPTPVIGISTEEYLRNMNALIYRVTNGESAKRPVTNFIR